MRSISSPARLTVLAALVFVLAVLATLAVPTASVDAEPAHGTHIDYYSSGTYCVQVGFEYYNCDGILESSWGYPTAYPISRTWGCLN